MVVQEHLEASRRRAYRAAYDFLNIDLKENMTYQEFVSSADSGRALFQDVESYRFATYEVEGTSAEVTGYIRYRSGGHCRVEATLTREGDPWKISLITVIYQ